MIDSVMSATGMVAAIALQFPVTGQPVLEVHWGRRLLVGKQKPRVAKQRKGCGVAETFQGAAAGEEFGLVVIGHSIFGPQSL
jgi:hypothetical protein